MDALQLIFLILLYVSLWVVPVFYVYGLKFKYAKFISFCLFMLMTLYNLWLLIFSPFVLLLLKILKLKEINKGVIFLFLIAFLYTYFMPICNKIAVVYLCNTKAGVRLTAPYILDGDLSEYALNKRISVKYEQNSQEITNNNWPFNTKLFKVGDIYLDNVKVAEYYDAKAYWESYLQKQMFKVFGSATTNNGFDCGYVDIIQKIKQGAKNGRENHL